MRCWILPAALAAAACGGRAHPAAAPTPAAAAARPAPAAIDRVTLDLDGAERMWRGLGLTGENHAARLATVTDPELRRAMAVAILRAGEVTCEAFEEMWGCGDVWYELAPLAPDATLDDPCLRRELALWALGELDPDDVRLVEDELVALAAMPDPERDLPAAAFAAAGDDGLRLRMLRVAPRWLAEQRAADLETPAAALAAVRELKLAGAAGAVPWASRPRQLVAALADDALPVATRLDLLAELDPLPDAVAAPALAALADDGSCQVAMAAADRLAGRGDPSRLPRRPRSTDPAAHAAALCRLAHDPDPDRRDARWREWLPDHGLTRIARDEYPDRYDEDGDGDGDGDDHEDEPSAREPRSVSQLDFELPSDWRCDGDTCTAHGGWDATLELAFAPDGDTLALVRVETVYSYHGCGC